MIQMRFAIHVDYSVPNWKLGPARTRPRVVCPSVRLVCNVEVPSGWNSWKIPSFQLGTVTLAGGKSCLSVRAINRSTSGFPNALENQTSLPLLASYKGGLLYVLTVYPAESWARPRVISRLISLAYFLSADPNGPNNALASVHGVGVITKLYFIIFVAFKEWMTLNLSQRSFKVIYFGGNRKPVYDFI